MTLRNSMISASLLLGASVGAASAMLMLIPAAASAQNAVDFAAGAGGQVTFVMPSNNVECTFTPQGGTATYKPFDGGPELSCDRSEPNYVRVVLTPKSLKRFDDVGDQGCCGTENPFRYGGHWSKGPFACDSTESGLTCKRNDGRGFVMSRERVDLF
jgi:hypothetical protein